jgi:hypothetical protein
VFGASLAGARKYYLAQPSVRYRVHDANQFFGRKIDACAVYRRRLAINALFEHLQTKFCYNADRFADFHHREFYTIAKPTFRQLKQYFSINARLPLSFTRRLNNFAAITAHYLRPSSRRTSSAPIATARMLDHAGAIPSRAAA